MPDRSTPSATSPARPVKPASVLALTTPVAMGYIPLGAVFGFLFVQAGGHWALAWLASLLIYAGAAQYLMIPMLAAGMPLAAIALATLVVNLRHVFYGLSLLERLPRGRLLRAYMAFALTDETYSILTTLPASTPARQMALLALLNHGWWMLGTALGALIGSQARLTLAGLDFVLAALFAVLTVEQWRSRRNATPVWVALAAYGLAYPVAPQHALVLAIALSLAAGFWLAEKSHDD
jgi:4-azaleucine resistance transporter AzlC